MYQFGTNSQRELDKAHPDLRKILVCALSRSPIDFGISGSARTFDEQLGYFLDEQSRLDPRIPEHLEAAKHVITETRPLAEAVDIYAYHPEKDIRFDYNHLSVIYGVIHSVAIELYNDGKITRLVRWGGNWNRDGIVIIDQKFKDLVHIELDDPEE